MFWKIRMNPKLIIFSSSVAVLTVAATFAIFSYFKEKPFYQRLKEKKKRHAWRLQNIETQETKIFGDLTNGKASFSFSLNFLNPEIIHIQINDPQNPRYVVQDVVILEPEDTTEDITITRKGSNVHIRYTHVKIVINCDDFKLSVFKNDDPFLFMNSQKCFTIEEKEPHVGLAADFEFVGALRAYGLPQHAEKLTLTPTTNQMYRLFNADRFAYSTSNPHESLYGAVPLVYAHAPNQSTGLLWLNASETFVDVDYYAGGLSTRFFSESGALDFYVLTGPTMKDCVRQNSELTGAVSLPPLFALGYHQCRYSYMSQDEIIEVSDKFDKNELPLDCVWMDIDYTDDKKYFSWNPVTYANPEKLLEFLDRNKRKAVAIIDPHIKVDDDYFVYAQCQKRDLFVKNPNKTTFRAKCWPGTSSWIDFFNPEARHFYAGLHKDFVKARNLHIWNDMNEPALFETKENAMPKNVVHFGDWKHRDVHNLYGFYQTMATYEGLLDRPDLRPFVLTRSHFAGSQRYAAIWTGDNTATWEHLQISIPMCLTASIAGFSLCGADVGGFVKHPDDELLQRWYQVGTWLPFFRNHSNRNVPRREPYLYDKIIQRRIRNCLQERYKHLLYWYSLFWQHNTTLQPVVRPLVYQYPHDELVLDLDSEFLVGDSILVCPVIHAQVTHLQVYLPGGDEELWYNEKSKIHTYKGSGYYTIPVNMDTVPVFYRGGCIIPIVEDSLKSSAFIKDRSITLYVFYDNNKNATGTFYFDDMESFSYLKNEYVYIRFDFDDYKISNMQINRNSGYNQPIILNAINLYGYEKSIKGVEIRVDKVGVDREVAVLRKTAFVRIEGININIQERFSINLITE